MTQAASKAQSQGSPFWHFSLGFYRAPGVAEACIRLQDEAAVDVNLLFFLLWQGSLKRRLTAAEVEAADGKVSAWRESAVVPLRNIRRALKDKAGLIEPSLCELFRTKVKGLELEAERLEQEALYEFAQSAILGEPAATPDEAARANIDAYESCSSRRFPKAAADAVIDAFVQLHRR